jgi:hypothetical protein
MEDKMKKTEFDEVVEISAIHFIEQMSLENWLGSTLGKKGFDRTDITKENIRTIIVKTIIQLYDGYKEEIEYEEEDEDMDQATDEEILESKEIDDEEKDEVDKEQRDEDKENEETDNT